MAQAWAVGDLGGIKASYSEQRFESCIQSMPSFAALFQRAVNNSLGAANAALAKPGKTVMAVPLGALLRKGGLLDRLMRRRSDGRGAGNLIFGSLTPSEKPFLPKQCPGGPMASGLENGLGPHRDRA